jgi:hypothetical protein
LPLILFSIYLDSFYPNRSNLWLKLESSGEILQYIISDHLYQTVWKKDQTSIDPVTQSEAKVENPCAGWASDDWRCDNLVTPKPVRTSEPKLWMKPFWWLSVVLNCAHELLGKLKWRSIWWGPIWSAWALKQKKSFQLHLGATRCRVYMLWLCWCWVR